MQQHGGANAHSRAGHSGNQWLGEISQRMQELKHRALLGQTIASALARQKVANVIACAEHRGIALQHHHAHSVIGGSASQSGCHCAIHGLGDGVFLVYTVECDGAHTGFGVYQDVLGSGICHGFSCKKFSSKAVLRRDGVHTPRLGSATAVPYSL